MPAFINEAHWKGQGMARLHTGELWRALKPKQDPCSPTFKHSSVANIHLGMLPQPQLQGQKGLCGVYSSLLLQYLAPRVFTWMHHAFMHQGNAGPQSRPLGLSLKGGCWSWIARHTSFSSGFILNFHPFCLWWLVAWPQHNHYQNTVCSSLQRAFNDNSEMWRTLFNFTALLIPRHYLGSTTHPRIRCRRRAQDWSLGFTHFTKINNPKCITVPALFWVTGKWVLTAAVLIKRYKSLIPLSVSKSLFLCQPKIKNCTRKVISARWLLQVAVWDLHPVGVWRLPLIWPPCCSSHTLC